MISFENIRVAFGDFVAIPDFSLEIEEGEFFTLLGPSGCGKSTALRTLAGFIKPASGRVKVAGKDVTSLPSDRRGIGMVFQNYALFPSMSVRENIAFGLKVQKVSKGEIRERVEKIASEVELTPEQLEKDVSALSGGQQQRVAIARALVMRPRILLLDEPLSNLDAKLRGQLRVQLKELQQQFGITSIYVTHDQDEALAMSDRVAVLNRGEIEQVGTPREVYETSRSEFVCNFIGSVNRLSPEITASLAKAAPGTVLAEVSSYLRVERAGLARAGVTPQDGSIAVDAIVDSQAYHGSSVMYKVRTYDQVLRIQVPYQYGQEIFSRDDRVSVLLHPRDLLQYDASGMRTNGGV
ncbi:ABC transporter ATP-binding protein [Dermabacteraceae bacterium TAE3-ERU27]|nr:ABC transporter ATP-binding protein [Dermabacteraceae bacterium TAE3-ERU27]